MNRNKMREQLGLDDIQPIHYSHTDEEDEQEYFVAWYEEEMRELVKD